MHKQTTLLAAFLLPGLLLGACAGPGVDPYQPLSVSVEGEPIVVFMDIGGVT